MRGKLPLLIIAMLLMAVAAAGCGDDDDSGATAGGASANGTSATDATGGGASGDDATADNGGGGEETSLPDSELSQEEYVKQVSAACAKRRAKLLPEMTAFLGGEEETKAFTPGDFGPVLENVVVPALEDEAEIIRSLGAPDGDGEEIEAILAQHAAAVGEVKKLKNATSFEEISNHFETTNKTMQEYGFTSCTNQ